MNDEQAAVDVQQDLTRPARKQVPAGPVTGPQKRPQQTPDTVNIWSGRQLGPRGERGSCDGRRQQPSAHRCKPILDSGKTKGSQGNVNTFCIFFAKGMCSQGPDCPYLHRLPSSADNAAMARNIAMDIFGREKAPAGMENKKGAGSYELDMTTLYVNYGGAGHYAVPQLRHLLLQNFGEFGPVRHIHIVPSKTIAFIKYHWRVSAEFAREAMDQQQLTGSTLNEVLAVRWAYDDPNPVAVAGRKRQAFDAVEAAAMQAWEALPPEEKRARMAMAQQARARRVSAVASAMPEPLLAASAQAGAYAGDDSYEAWRGISGDGQGQGYDPHAAAAAGAAVPGPAGGPGGLQQHQAQEAGAEAHGSAQDAAAAWQAHYAQWPEQQQQQQQQVTQEAVGGQAAGAGSWFQGWQQRHKPQTFADALGAAAGAGGAAGAATAGADDGGAADAAASGSSGGLGLLAGYGSDSDSGGTPAPDSPKGSRQQGGSAGAAAAEQQPQPP